MLESAASEERENDDDFFARELFEKCLSAIQPKIAERQTAATKAGKRRMSTQSEVDEALTARSFNRQ